MSEEIGHAKERSSVGETDVIENPHKEDVEAAGEDMDKKMEAAILR